MDTETVVRIVLLVVVVAVTLYIASLLSSRFWSPTKIDYGLIAPLPAAAVVTPQVPTVSVPPVIIQPTLPPSATTAPVTQPPTTSPTVTAPPVTSPPVTAPPAPQQTPVPQPTTPPASSAVWSTILEWDFPGNDLTRFGNATPTTCKAACEKDASCKAASYDSRIKACFLKTSLSAKQPLMPGERVTYMKPPATAMRVNPHANTNIPDTADMYVVSTGNASSCGQLCNLHDSCAGATFYEDGSRRCRLKTSSASATPFTGRTSYY